MLLKEFVKKPLLWFWVRMLVFGQGALLSEDGIDGSINEME